MKFTASVAVLAIAVFSTVGAQTGTYTNFVNSALSPTQYAVTSATLSPYPLCINKTACLTLTGTLSTPIIEGTVYNVAGRFSGRLVYSDKTDDMCALLAESGTPCPIPAGPVTLNLCRLTKPNAAPILYSIWRFQLINGDGGVVFDQSTNTTSTATYCP